MLNHNRGRVNTGPFFIVAAVTLLPMSPLEEPTAVNPSAAPRPAQDQVLIYLGGKNLGKWDSFPRPAQASVLTDLCLKVLLICLI